MITTTHVAVSPITGERHTLIKVPDSFAGSMWKQTCQSGYWFLTCACEDDEGCVSP